MDKFLDRTKNIIFSRQTSIFASTMLLSGMIIIARFFGFIQYRVLTGIFTTPQLDLFFGAFRIPDLVFEILITGALTSTFIPFFIKYKNSKETQDNISSVVNLIFFILIGAVILLSLILPFVMGIITPGFSPSKIRTITTFTQLLLIGQLPFLVMGNFLSGISQSRKSFFLPSLAPIVYNVSIILFTLTLSHSISLLAPVTGVIVGAFMFFLIQLPILKDSEFQYRFIIKRTKAIGDFFRMAIPRILTVVAAQIDATIDMTLATLLGPGSFTIFYLAQRLQLLPVSVIGIAFGQASLPYLTELYQEKRIPEFKKLVVDSILDLIFLTIPIMSYFVFARTPIVRFVFGGQQFDWESTVLTAVTLSYFSLSLPFHSIYYFITRCFYALFDSKTPFYISVISIIINTVLSLLFTLVFHFPVWALALSFSASIIVNVVVLLVFLYRRLGGYDLKMIFIETSKICIATIGASVPVYFLQKLLDGLVFDTTRTINIFLLLLTSGICYFLLYLLLAWIIDIKEIHLLQTMTLKVNKYKQKIFELYSQLQ